MAGFMATFVFYAFGRHIAKTQALIMVDHCCVYVKVYVFLFISSSADFWNLKQPTVYCTKSQMPSKCAERSHVCIGTTPKY